MARGDMSGTSPANDARPPRRGLALGVAAVVVLAGVTYGVLRPSPETRPVAATSPSPDPAQSFPALTRETGLAVAGPSMRGVAVLDVDTGRTSQVGPADPMTDAVAPIEGGWLLARREQCVTDGPCAPSEILAVRRGRVTRIGLAHTALPDPDGRTVWLTRYPALSPDDAQWLERRTYDGALVGARTRLKPYDELVAVGPDGPVVEGEEAVVTLVRAESRERVPVIEQGRVLGMAGRLVVWAELSCQADGARACAISTTEPGTGVTAEVVEIDGFVAFAAVDPAGEHVAVGTHDAAGGVDVVSYFVSTGRAQKVTGESPPRLDALTWSPDGRWLVLVDKPDDDERFDGQRLAVWAPGDETASDAGTFESELDGRLVAGLAR